MPRRKKKMAYERSFTEAYQPPPFDTLPKKFHNIVQDAITRAYAAGRDGADQAHEKEKQDLQRQLVDRKEIAHIRIVEQYASMLEGISKVILSENGHL